MDPLRVQGVAQRAESHGQSLPSILDLFCSADPHVKHGVLSLPGCDCAGTWHACVLRMLNAGQMLQYNLSCSESCMLAPDPVKGGQALLLIANVMDQRAPGGWHVEV